MMQRAAEGFWCHVAGKIEDGEAAWQTARRELLEETGLGVERLYSAEYLEQFYDESRNCITMIPAFVAMFRALPDITLDDEHLDYHWCSLEEALELAEYPNQRALYRHVWENFVEQAPSPRMRVKC